MPASSGHDVHRRTFVEQDQTKQVVGQIALIAAAVALLLSLVRPD